MIDVGVRQQYHIHLSRSNRQIFIHKGIYALLHSTVNENLLSTCFQIRTASGNFMGCT